MDTTKMISDFIEICKISRINLNASDIDTIVQTGDKHIPPKLPDGKIAVYVFINSTTGECYKVGKAGKGARNRYQYQHYRIDKTPSTLAKSLILDPPIDIEVPSPKDVGQWIMKNTTRTNFLIPFDQGGFVLNLFEAYVQTQLNPKYEGR